MKKQVISLLFFVLAVPTFGQNNTDSLNIIFPESVRYSTKFKKAIEKQTEEYYRLFSNDSSLTNSYSSQFILDKIDNDSSYYYIFLAQYWISFHYKEMIPELITRLTNTKEVGLINTADLIIMERNFAGDLKFYGHGYLVNDDLFTVAGRANHLLTTITGECFDFVSMNSTKQELELLQKRWITWLEKIKRK